MKKAKPTNRAMPPPEGGSARDGGVSPDLLAQLTRTLWLPHDLSETERDARRAAAHALVADIGPAGGVETLLACQMVAAHEAAMLCLARSMAPDAPPPQAHQDRRHAARLMALFTRQVDALGRHRLREVERRERLARERQNETRRAWLASMDAPQGAVIQALVRRLVERDGDQNEADHPGPPLPGPADGAPDRLGGAGHRVEQESKPAAKGAAKRSAKGDATTGIPPP